MADRTIVITEQPDIRTLVIEDQGRTTLLTDEAEPRLLSVISGVEGPPGPQGPQGPTGPAGDGSDIGNLVLIFENKLI